jgi:hypothetical protein
MGLGLDWWKGVLSQRPEGIGPVRVPADQVLDIVDVSKLGLRAQSRVLHGIEAVFLVTSVSFDDFGVVLGCFLGPLVTESLLYLVFDGYQWFASGFSWRHATLLVCSSVKDTSSPVLDHCSMGELVIDLPISLHLHRIPS